MRVFIDNLDGKGSVEYTSFLQLDSASRVTRKLNQPSTCTFLLLTGIQGVLRPALSAKVLLDDGQGRSIFAGHVASLPDLHAVGAGEQGSVYVAQIVAVSDGVLLDDQPGTQAQTLLGRTVLQQWTSLMDLAPGTWMPLTLSQESVAPSRFGLEVGTRWSEAAKGISDNARSAYSVNSSGLHLTSLGEVTHQVAPDDPGLMLDGASLSDLRWLANDVTVCGRIEPTAYVTEVFAGDGITSSFTLSEPHFSPVAAQRAAIQDLFEGTSFNARIWTIADAGAHLALTAEGLTCGGGTGRDGESTISSSQQIELGGTVVFECSGLQVSSESTGIVCGLYPAGLAEAGCFAGFQVNTSTGATSLTPLVNGALAGIPFSPSPSRVYTLRLRVCCQEVERIRQSYTYLEAGGTGLVGGELVQSGGRIEFEIQDVTSGLAGVPWVLFDGSVTSLPPACIWGLLESGSLSCSMKSVTCTQSGPLWVSAGLAGSAAISQIVASAPSGGACRISTGGLLEFYPANVPQVNALVYASYRLRGRAIARQTSGTQLNAGPGIATGAWIGTVTSPPGWSSVDCDYAASALLGFAAGGAAAVGGSYKAYNLEHAVDVSPGDALNIGPYVDGSMISAIVREVSITLAASVPDALEYKARFANDWAESISIKVSNAIPEDAVVPQQATNVGSSLQSLAGLVLAGVNGTTVSLNVGANPPLNGGFEVRRRDGTFGPGVDSDLVLRTAAVNIIIPRSAAIEQYYIRTFDAAIPPNYSLFSAAIFLNVPL